MLLFLTSYSSKNQRKSITCSKKQYEAAQQNIMEEEWRGTESMLLVWYKSRVKFPQSVMIWAAMSSAGFGPLCFLKSTVNAAIYQDILEHFMLPSADKLYGDADFIFQQDLAPAHTVKGTKSTSKCFADHDITVLDWPANVPDLNPKSKIKNIRPKIRDELKAAIKATWASITSQQCHATLKL